MGGLTVIVYNPQKSLACEIFLRMKEKLEGLGFEVIHCSPHDPLFPLPDKYSGKKIDFAVSLGGDGTFLSCARKLSGNPVPILPVHLGTFGFITEVPHKEWEETLDGWLAGDLDVESRLMLSVEVRRNGKTAAKYCGANDAVISAAGISKMVRLSVELGGYKVGHFQGDGIIVATPTGSTGHSLASGGPIVVPSMDALVFTPLSPFSLSWRSTVLPVTDETVVCVEPEQRVDVQLSVDGQELFPLEKNDEIHMKGVPGGFKIIQSGRRVFYEVIRSKLGWSGGVNA